MLRLRISACFVYIVLAFLVALGIGSVAAQTPLLTLGYDALNVSVELSGPFGAHGVFSLAGNEPFLVRVVVDREVNEDGLAATLSIYDHKGAPIRSESVAFRVAEGASIAELDVTSLQPGWYRVEYVIQSRGSQTVLTRGWRDLVILRGGSDAMPAPEHRPFGVVNSRLQPYEAALLREVGVGWIMDAATPTWREVQFQPGGPFIWRSRVDSLGAAVETGLIPVGSIGEAPAWFEDGGQPRDLYLADFFRLIDLYQKQLPPRSALSAAAPFRSVLEDEDRLEQVLRMKVISSFLTEPMGAERHIVELQWDGIGHTEALAPYGVLEGVDALLVHLPAPVVQPEQVDWDRLRRLRTEWRRAGSTAAIWTVLEAVPNTEAGSSSGADSQSGSVLRLFGTPTPSETAPRSTQSAFDSPLQAEWLIRAHLLQLAHGVDRVFTSPFSTGPSELRLFTGGAGAFPDVPQRPRPALAAYATMVEQLNGAVYLGQLSMPAGIWALVFSKSGEPLLVVWTTRSQATLELNDVVVSSVEVTDLLGARSVVEVHDRRLLLPITPAPRYVSGLDLGLFAQVLIDHFDKRVSDVASVVDPASAARLKAVSAAVYDLATRLWLEVAEGDEGRFSHVVPTWYETVHEMLQVIEALLVGGAPEKAAAYELFDLLAVLGELGAALGIVDNPDEQAAQIQGTAALLAEAQEALEGTVRADGAFPRLAHRIMEKVNGWWEVVASPSTRASAAWAVVVREAAALALLAAEVEDLTMPGLFLLVEETSLLRPYPGFRPYEPPQAIEPALSRFEELLSSWLSLSEDVAKFRKAQTKAGSSVPAEAQRQASSEHEPGWDELDVPLIAVNVTGRDVMAQIVLDAPEGWFWRLGEHVLPVDDQPRASIALPGAADSAAATGLDVALLVPYGISEGAYQVGIRLEVEGALADRILYTVRVTNVDLEPGPATQTDEGDLGS